MNKYLRFNFWKSYFTRTLVRKRLTKNFISLSILQALNYLLPLATLPYLVRVLGPEKFGLYSFAQAFVGYFVILTNYGFILSATREISINRENKKRINEIFSSVIVVKFILAILSLIILSLLLIFIPRFRNDWLLYIFTFGAVLGDILFPVWFFQGMERMKYITILKVLSRGIYTICIFIFIRDMNDYIFVPLIYATGSFIAGVLSLGIVFRNFKLKFTLPNLEILKHRFREGWHVFISTISISLYTTSNVFILGLFTNNTIVGYYSVVEKIVRAMREMLTPVSQTVYPYISKLATDSKQKALHFIRKLVLIVGTGSFIISILLFIFAGYIINIFFGNQYQQSIIILRILAFLPFLISLTNIFGIQTMLTFNFKKAYSKIFIAAGLLNIFLTLVLVQFYQHIGVSIALIITEIIIMVSMLFYLERIGIKIFRGKFLPRKK